MYHKVCFVQSCVFVQIAQGLKFISFLNKSYYPYFGTEESQYLIYFIQTQGFLPCSNSRTKRNPTPARIANSGCVRRNCLRLSFTKEAIFIINKSDYTFSGAKIGKILNIHPFGYIFFIKNLSLTNLWLKFVFSIENYIFAI